MASRAGSIKGCMSKNYGFRALTGVAFMRFVLCTLLVVAASTMALGFDAVLDDFDTANGWTGPFYQYGATGVGEGALENGQMRLTRYPYYPLAKYCGVYFQKSFNNVVLEPNTWVHLRFREEKMVLGADAYFTIRQGDTSIACWGVNGEEHWVDNALCVEKTYDNEVFLCSNIWYGDQAANPVKTWDFRVNINNALAVKYTDWHIFSFKYELDGGVRRLRFMVDGRDMVYRDISCYYPNGQIDNRVVDNYQPTQDPLTVELLIMNDADEYADTSKWRGTRDKHAYAQWTPAMPSLMVYPAGFNYTWNQVKSDWMVKYDAVWAIYDDQDAIWQGIYAGTIDLETAVLMGAIPLPDASHLIWNHFPAGTRDVYQSELNVLNSLYPVGMPMYKRYCHQKAFETGTTSRADFFRYLTPQEIREGIHWQQLSAQEQSEIPELASLVNGTIYWDYVMVASDSNVSQLNWQIKQLIYEGRLTPLVAVLTNMLTWQDAEIFSQWMSQADIDAVRSSPLGSPTFGDHGFISGYLTDVNENPVANATVIVAPGNLSTTTGSDGSYNFLTINPGTYTISASKPAYFVSTISNVAVTARQTTNLNIPNFAPGCWEFDTDGDLQGWSTGNGVGSLSVGSGCLSGQINSTDSYIVSAAQPVVAMYTSAVVHVGTKATSGSTAKLSWGPAGNTSYDPAREIPFQIVADGQLHDYEVDVSANQMWDGAVGSLRVYPSDSVAGNFAVDYVRVLRKQPVGSITINAGAVYTGLTTVQLTLSATGFGSVVDSVRFSNDGQTWSDWQPYSAVTSWILSSGGGNKTVYAEFRDSEGTISEPYSASIILDDVPPRNCSVAINSGAAYTTSRTVTLTLSATPGGMTGVTQMRLMNSGGSWTNWQSYATSMSWTLASGNGTKTVYAQFMSGAGAASSTSSASIILDATAPSTPGKPTCSGAYTTSSSITFTWGASTDSGSGISGYTCQIGSIPGAGDVFDGIVGNVLSKTLTGAVGGHYFCRVRSVDKAGNTSSWNASVDGITVVDKTGIGLGAVKGFADNASFGISSAVVSAVFGDCFYVEDTARISGIRVQPLAGIPTGLAIGSKVDIGGVLRTNSMSERFAEATVLVIN